MMEFGKTLRLAREAKGYTAAQVAELTKMAPSTVADLENENFSKIAAPIYGRGFVKLYCEAVGIDPKPMVEEFIAIYNGERGSVIRERKPSEPAAAEPPPAPEAPPVPPPPPQPAPPAQSLFDEPQEPPAAAAEPPQAADPFAFQETEPAEAAPRPAQRTLSRYAAPVRTMHMPSVPPAVWRIAVLGTLALLLLWGLAVGVRALYRATTSDKAATTEETARPQEASPKAEPTPAPAKPKAATRKPQKIPHFYAD